MTIYSHSKLSTFEQCPLKYKYKYIDKIKPLIEKTIEAHLGSSVHDALEWLYNNAQKKIIPTIDDIINYYINSWEQDYNDKILIVKEGLTAKDYFNKGVEFLMNYYSKYYPFKDGTIECEKRISIILEGDIKIQGFIDRLVHNIETGEYEIHDYKTANSLPTREKIDEDRQLALYSIAIKEHYGKDKEVVLIWHYLAHNQKISSKRTNEQLEKLKKETLKLIKNIESAEKFPPNKSVLCHWCEYKSICPVWNPDIRDIAQMQKTIKDFEIKENEKEPLDIWD